VAENGLIWGVDGTNTTTDNIYIYADNTWQQLTAGLSVKMQTAFKGSVSNYEQQLAQQTIANLGQDPANIPIALGIMRTMALRGMKWHELRGDYINANDFKTAGMEKWVNQQLPGYDPQHPDEPPPVFSRPPKLKFDDLPANATPDEKQRVMAADTEAQRTYFKDPSHNTGIPFQVYNSVPGPGGTRQRVLQWVVRWPDGSEHYQQFPTPKGQ